MRNTLLAVCSVAWFVACEPATTELTTSQVVAIQTAVDETAAYSWRTWITQEDIDGYIRYLSDWAGAPWSGDASIDDHRASILAHWERWDYESMGSPEWEVEVLAPNVATAKGTAEVVRTDTTGIVEEWSIDMAHVWALEDGEWKMLVARVYWNRTNME